METMTKTLEDWFGDVSGWLDECLWPRALRHVLQGVAEAYLLQLANSPAAGVTPAASAISLARRTQASEQKGRGMRRGRALAATGMSSLAVFRRGKLKAGTADGDSGDAAASAAHFEEGASKRTAVREGLQTGASAFSNSAHTALRIETDARQLVTFFDQFEDDLEMARLGMSVEEFVAPFYHLAALLRTNNPQEGVTGWRSLLEALENCNLPAFPAADPPVFRKSASRLLVTVWARKPEVRSNTQLGFELDLVLKRLFAQKGGE